MQALLQGLVVGITALYLHLLQAGAGGSPAEYEVDDVASPATIEYAISEWLAQKLDKNGIGFIYMIDHGQDGGHFNIDENGDGYLDFDTEYIKNVEVGAWLNQIPRYKQLITVIECCYAGDFITHISGVNRIGITSSDGFHESYIGQDGWSYFSHAFFQSLAIGSSVERAFKVAHKNVFLHVPFQNPLISDYSTEETYIGQYRITCSTSEVPP